MCNKALTHNFLKKLERVPVVKTRVRTELQTRDLPEYRIVVQTLRYIAIYLFPACKFVRRLCC